MFESDDVELERFLGTQGFMSISSYTPTAGMGPSGYGEDLGMAEMQQLGGQELAEGEVSVRLYTGQIVRGPLSGSRVLLKAYPSSRVSPTADAMAANEVATHAALQPPTTRGLSPYLSELMGGFQVTRGASAGEQWLVFKNDGIMSAAQYAAAAGQATADGKALGEGQFWDSFDGGKGALARRRAFVVGVLRQAMCGLAHLHANCRLHQSLGPSSVVLAGTEERDVRTTGVKLRDLGFAVDVSDAALYGGPTLGEIWDNSIQAKADPIKDLAIALWARARQEGATTEAERRAYGFADDVYAGGLLLAFLAFVPLCPPGSVDGPSLQRLLESTFRLDIGGFRDYADADERWKLAVEFLDAGGGQGWDLLGAMLDADWRRRPTAESCLKHPFLTGEAFGPNPPPPPGRAAQQQEQPPGEP